VPVTSYSPANILPTGSRRIVEPSSTPAPMIGLTSPRRRGEPARQRRLHAHLQCCVSFAMSASPAISTFAAGPLIRRLLVLITPLLQRDVPVISSNA
jgi:hypothetical protein